MTRSEQREEFYADIIVGAVEGGTGYWAQVSKYKHNVGGGAETAADVTATFHDMEGEDDKGVKVTLDSIARAFGTLTGFRVSSSYDINGRPALETPSGERAFISEGYRKHLLTAYKTMDAGDLDADDCDVLVQLAIFGTVVYG